MGVSVPERVRASTSLVEQPFQQSSGRPPKNNFGTIVRALWPDKPALNLAQRIGSTERGAQYLIDGERKVTARAIAVIIAEILD